MCSHDCRVVHRSLLLTLLSSVFVYPPQKPLDLLPHWRTYSLKLYKLNFSERIHFEREIEGTGKFNMQSAWQAFSLINNGVLKTMSRSEKYKSQLAFCDSGFQLISTRAERRRRHQLKRAPKEHFISADCFLCLFYNWMDAFFSLQELAWCYQDEILSPPLTWYSTMSDINIDNIKIHSRNTFLIHLKCIKMYSRNTILHSGVFFSSRNLTARSQKTIETETCAHPLWTRCTATNVCLFIVFLKLLVFLNPVLEGLCFGT